MQYRVRGALNSIYDPSYNTGIIFAFVLGNYSDYNDQAKFQLILPIIFILILTQLPESPEYLRKQQNDKVRNLINPQN